ncbi:LPXTG cell wall anchor domain-containing protein [Halopiger aswanensis]|uniref:LPXTG-motif cell wall-anchored protein n=1 Tax=Halopiger aswanensis TaxID=148449 RepID=A0A3R7HK98_9EURY|nr:LPXTG cell wall anchor domain-containing protein [Halopiger aswanensis]RKD97596.1 LPXTG-motif cell wall-anchored protein [Halopiger aswanensis]
MFDDRPPAETVRSTSEAAPAPGRDDSSRSALLAGALVLALLLVGIVLGVRRREEPGLEPPF